MKSKYDWQQIISDFDNSSMPVTQYCAELGIPKASFYQYRKRFRTKKEIKAPKQATFAEVKVKQPSSLSTDKNEPCLRIQTPRGYVLEIFL